MEYTGHMATNLISQVEEWILAELDHDNALNNEEVIYTLSVQTFPEPAPNDEGGVVARPGLVLYLEIPGPTDDTHCYISDILPPVLLTPDVVRDTVERALSRMRQERENHLTAASADS